GFESISKPNVEGRYMSPEVKCSLYDQLMFSWVNPLINKGFRSTLDHKDIFELPSFAQAKNILKIFNSFKKPSFIKSLFFTFRKELLIQFIYSILWSLTFSIIPPYFLRKLLLYVQNYPKGSHETAYLYSLGFFLGSVVPSLFFQQALHIGRHLSVKCHAIIIGHVYLKSLSRKDTSGVGTKNKAGKITNLMAVDAQKVSEFVAYLFYNHYFSIIVICLAWYIGSGRLQTIQKRLMSATDKRMNVINELLRAIRVIKCFALEDHFRAKVLSARDYELKEVKSRLIEWVYLSS
ncbi:1504_t:CDS:2, partial [Scutellospora calospora]